MGKVLRYGLKVLKHFATELYIKRVEATESFIASFRRRTPAMRSSDSFSHQNSRRFSLAVLCGCLVIMSVVLTSLMDSSSNTIASCESSPVV
ncbi:hypothetical protein B296_00042129 [Ensete ventricosum]|uniref:Uncharacterized protein n=1 Tax=Ensete ventricosum TaxID=4639 RepID=A0A426ZEV4_ENSVE|nr:hypothetical protein B296_00042129 [Ensete ventricosum]